MNTGGRLSLFGLADGIAPFVAEALRHIDLADDALTETLHGLLEAGVTADLSAVLTDSLRSARGLHEFTTFENIVGARLLDVDVFLRLHRPDGRQRVPMVRRRNAEHVDVFVVEHLANVDVSLCCRA